MAESDQIWSVTVIRSDGLYFMRPDKWRPIVTIEIGEHLHETTLGRDGQNPNCKELLPFQEADLNSKVEIKIWHRPTSKKKKKRNLVASATHSFAELLKRQNPKTHVPVKLICRASTKRAGAASRGKPQSGAVLHLRIRPPSSVILDELETNTPEATLSDNESCVSSERPSTPTDLFTPDVLIHDEDIKPYSIESEDDEAPPYDESEAVKKSLFDCRPTPLTPPTPSTPLRINPVAWLAASLLPRFTEKVVVPPELNRLERIMATFTAYAELKTAQTESRFEEVFRRFQMEWTYVGGLLVALAAVNTAVFSISPDSMFTVDSYARAAIATSSVASGLGIATDAWFVLRYTYADLETFISRAKDVYGTYFFFSLSARVPTICMLMSATSLMAFLALVAFDAWPNGTLVVCFFIGLIMTLQFLVYGVHWFGKRIAQGGRGLVRRMSTTN